MVKIETIGMYEVAKINPVLKSTKDVANYSFLANGGVTYLICNSLTGDDSYKDDYVFPAGEYLNGYDVKAWEGQKLVVDEKHIAYGSGEDYEDLVALTTALTINSDGKLAIASETPSSGIYFMVTDKTTLTEKAVKVRVTIA